MLKLKVVASGVILAALISPAMADYWVVQDNPSTQKCSVVEKKSQPGDAQAKPAGGIVSFQTQAEAVAFIQRHRECGGSSD